MRQIDRGTLVSFLAGMDFRYKPMTILFIGPRAAATFTDIVEAQAIVGAWIKWGLTNAPIELVDRNAGLHYKWIHSEDRWLCTPC